MHTLRNAGRDTQASTYWRQSSPASTALYLRQPAQGKAWFVSLDRGERSASIIRDSRDFSHLPLSLVLLCAVQMLLKARSYYSVL